MLRLRLPFEFPLDSPVGFKLASPFVSTPCVKIGDALEFFAQEPLCEIVDTNNSSNKCHTTPDYLIAAAKRHWWDPASISFDNDRNDWRSSIIWPHRIRMQQIGEMFFLGDLAVSRLLKPIADNAPKEDERRYLVIQEEEERHHTEFFRSFLEQVLDIKGTEQELERRFRRQVLESFNKAFDELARVVGELQDRKTIEAWTQAVTIYHLIAEGVIAARGTLVIGDILRRTAYENLLTGFRKGFKNVCRDESLHIRFGVQGLLSRVLEVPDLARVIGATLVRMSGFASGVNLPGLPEFEELPRKLGQRLEIIGFTPKAIQKVKELYPA